MIDDVASHAGQVRGVRLLEARETGIGEYGVRAACVLSALSRVHPDRYPLGDEVAAYVAAERNVGKMLDYGLIGPRLQQLYEWSAGELDEPALLACIRDGSPTYAWSFADREVWHPTRLAPTTRAIERVLPPLDDWERR